MIETGSVDGNDCDGESDCARCSAESAARNVRCKKNYSSFSESRVVNRLNGDSRRVKKPPPVPCATLFEEPAKRSWEPLTRFSDPTTIPLHEATRMGLRATNELKRPPCRFL